MSKKLDHVYTGENKFLNGRIFFICATRLNGTVLFLLQIAVLFAVQKRDRFRGSRVNKRWICVGYGPFKYFFRPPVETGSWISKTTTFMAVARLFCHGDGGRTHYRECRRRRAL